MLKQMLDHHRVVALLHAASARVPWRLWLLNGVLGLLPKQLGTAYRARLYRLAGFRHISPHGVNIEGMLHIRGDGDIYALLSIGPGSTIDSPCDIELGGRVVIGAGVSICHHTLIMTVNHRIGHEGVRAGAVTYQDVVIEDGVWVGAGVIICPGVTVGRGSVLTPGTVVMRDIPPHSLVQGTSARVLRTLGPDGEGDADSAATGGNGYHRTSPSAPFPEPDHTQGLAKRGTP